MEIGPGGDRVQSIFGIRAIRGQKRVEVEVHLTEWTPRWSTSGWAGRFARALPDSEIPLVTVPFFREKKSP